MTTGTAGEASDAGRSASQLPACSGQYPASEAAGRLGCGQLAGRLGLNASGVVQHGSGHGGKRALGAAHVAHAAHVIGRAISGASVVASSRSVVLDAGDNSGGGARPGGGGQLGKLNGSEHGCMGEPWGAPRRRPPVER